MFLSGQDQLMFHGYGAVTELSSAVMGVIGSDGDTAPNTQNIINLATEHVDALDGVAHENVCRGAIYFDGNWLHYTDWVPYSCMHVYSNGCNPDA